MNSKALVVESGELVALHSQLFTLHYQESGPPAKAPGGLGELTRQPDRLSTEVKTHLTMLIRKADATDSHDLWEWRNDPDTRKLSRHTGYVEWETHKEWFGRAIADPTRFFLIGVLDENIIGVVRFDAVSADTSEVSININPAFRGKRLGQDLLRRAIEEFLESRGVNTRLIAEIKQENLASRRIFEKLGFTIIEQDQEFCQYEFSNTRTCRLSGQLDRLESERI